MGVILPNSCYTVTMNSSFIMHHKREIAGFGIGVILAIVFLAVPALHDILRMADRLGYPGMLLAGIMYGSGLTAPIATVIFIDSPANLNPIVIGLLGGIGAACYDLAIFLLTRREAEHGWLATIIARIRARRYVPSWATMTIGTLILASPLPDELAAGLFGITNSKVAPFFLLSFASNTLGVLMLSGAWS
jgi:hypothetical protein